MSFPLAMMTPTRQALRRALQGKLREQCQTRALANSNRLVAELAVR